jgi:hypothetical protein
LRNEWAAASHPQAANQPGTLTGTVVGVEKQKQPASKNAAIENEVLNIWCAEGLRRFGFRASPSARIAPRPSWCALSTAKPKSGDVLRFDFPKRQSGRYVQIRTTESPSWVAWAEIELGLR